MKSSLSLIISGAVILLVLFLLSAIGKKPPLLPRDVIHQGIANQDACTSCHAPGKAAPLKERHPPKEQCLVCHKTTSK